MEQENYELPISLFVVHWNQPLECIATATALREQKIGLKTGVIDQRIGRHRAKAGLCRIR